VSFLWRLTRAGLIAVLLVGAAGWGLERVWLGGSDASALAHASTELARRFDDSARTLAAVSASVVDPGAVARAARDAQALRALFARAASTLPAGQTGAVGVTIYLADGSPLAWAGRVSELPRDRLTQSASLFLLPGAPGPRLVRLAPVPDPHRPGGERLATIVAEETLGDFPGMSGTGDTFTLPTRAGPATIQMPSGSSSLRGNSGYHFTISAADGTPLALATLDPSAIAATRARWRRLQITCILAVVALTLLFAAGPLLDRRRRARRTRPFVAASAGLALGLVIVRVVLWFAVAPWRPPDLDAALAWPVDLLIDALLACALAWLIFDLANRAALARRPGRLVVAPARTVAILGPAYLVAGAAAGFLLFAYARALGDLTLATPFDLLHFSLHPLSMGRLALAFGLVLLHASVIWLAVAVARLPAAWRRTTRHSQVRVAAPAWILGAVIAVALVRGTGVPSGPLLAALAGTGLCAAAFHVLRLRARRASQAERILWLFLALLTPAMAMYPTLLAFSIQAKEDLVAHVYAPEVSSLRSDIQERLRHALDQIDAMRSLETPLPVARSDSTDIARAFEIWKGTDLATYHLTSAVELYSAAGQLVSRFALSLPEQATPQYRAGSCSWDTYEENSPFGASDRHVLRASRGICEGNRAAGAIVVRVMLDYRRLAFVLPQNPYLESLSGGEGGPPEGERGRDVEFAMYGWSRAPIEASAAQVWPLPDDVFQRMVASRAPFWTTLRRDVVRYRVYLLNDRGGIYALGYPVLTAFGHLLNLAELTTLAGVLYVLMIAAGSIFSLMTSRTATSGRALLREIRSSFYRKLFLYFWAGAMLPVLILAVATRAYFTAQLTASEQESAAQTATVARRLVEDYVTLQQRNAISIDAVDDEIMVLVSRAIDQDVNLFERAALQATSDRALFASGLLTPRTPSDVYAGVILDRQKTFVGVETVAGVPYLLAAEPVRASGREGIVTVPLPLRQNETEQERDELDRRALLGAVLFSLMGAALGYWMAERVADPVNRLTRATRRIARGDLDARIAATSTDELRRLVEDFNRMAADLKRQRTELERTQRLEAWADMARQVAHEIKNPLTPIQLSAEHARRVNLDRGRPLSPVLDECINAILNQVRLLRQIAAEFSSFASSPTARPEPTRLPELIEEVVAPYRAGLAGRVAIALEAVPDLPEIALDRTLFARALTNVIENALHAMPGGGTLTIASSAADAPEGRILVIEIADTGVGMDAAAAARIFEPYFSTKATGTGLGLTIAKRNIELNGGTIEVRSTKGRGTTVTITLPLAPDA
jgi:signal transduction histidine kinase